MKGSWKTLYALGALSTCLAGGCQDTLSEEDDVLVSRLEYVAEGELLVFAHQPLNRVGCRTSSTAEEGVQLTYSNASLAEFLTQIKLTATYDASASRLSLARLARALGCMSAHDFAVTYDQIMGLVHELDKDPVLLVRLAPLVVLLTEYGSNALDQRAHYWLEWAQTALLHNHEESGEWADGIGFFQLRGITPIQMNAERSRLMVESFSSFFWTSTTCTLESTVYRSNQNDAMQLDPVCLLDECPQVDPRAIVDGDTYVEACERARTEFDGSVGTVGGGASGAGGSTSGSLSGSLANPSGAVGAIMECMAQFSTGSGARYTACVKAVADQRPVTNLSSTATLVTTMRPRGCSSNPIAQGNGLIDRKEEARKERARKGQHKDFSDALEEYQKEKADKEKSIDNLNKTRDNKKADIQESFDTYNGAKQKCASGNNGIMCAVADETKNQVNQELGKPDSHVPTQSDVNVKKNKIDATYDHYVKQVEDGIKDLYNKFKAKWSYMTKDGLESIDPDNPQVQTDKEYKPKKEEVHPGARIYKDGTNPAPITPDSSSICDTTDGGCSSTCDIRAQLETSLGHCLGNLPDYDTAPTPKEPGYDPTVAYPTPDDVSGDGAFDELNTCLMKALGQDVLVEDPAIESDDLCERISCASGEHASIKNNEQCSCGGRSIPSEIEQMGGWQGYTNQCAYMSCDGETTCGCYGFNPGLPITLPGVGQGPSDPTVFGAIEDPEIEVPLP